MAHIVIVIDENQDYSTIVGPGNSCPYINSLANGGALMTYSFGCGHQSEDNYDSLFFGNPEDGYDDPCPNPVGVVPSLGSELLQAGYSFCGYAEDLPSAGSTVCSNGNYNIHHCPWIQGNITMGGNLPVTCGQPFSAFPSNYGNLPTLSIVIPNQLDNMHSSTPAAGDAWLSANLSGYAAWCQTASNNSLLIVTWDENANASTDGDGTTVGNTLENQITTIFYGAAVVPGKYAELINHYNVLNTILSMYHLAQIGNSVGVSTISDIF
jgi:acid phosphatase